MHLSSNGSIRDQRQRFALVKTMEDRLLGAARQKDVDDISSVWTGKNMIDALVGALDEKYSNYNKISKSARLYDPVYLQCDKALEKFVRFYEAVVLNPLKALELDLEGIKREIKTSKHPMKSEIVSGIDALMNELIAEVQAKIDR